MQTEASLSTEDKIKQAARIVFTSKGYAATRTRDIAEQAGLNLALLNYYFRSKEKLFEIIMLEKLQQLFTIVAPHLNDPDTSLDEKIDRIAIKYIDMLLVNPDLPLFVLSEIRNNPEQFGKNIQLDTFVLKSHFINQLVAKKEGVNPLQFFITFLGMLVFPFIMKPVLQAGGAINEESFKQLMEERKVLVACWMKLILE